MGIVEVTYTDGNKQTIKNVASIGNNGNFVAIHIDDKFDTRFFIHEKYIVFIKVYNDNIQSEADGQ